MSTIVTEEKKTETKLNQLDQLKKFTKIVADTADFESIKEFKPQDATTNPSLVYAATQKPEYAHLLDEVLADRKKSGLSGAAQIEDIFAIICLCSLDATFWRSCPGAFLLKPTRVYRLMWRVRSERRASWSNFTKSTKFRASGC